MDDNRWILAAVEVVNASETTTLMPWLANLYICYAAQYGTCHVVEANENKSAVITQSMKLHISAVITN